MEPILYICGILATAITISMVLDKKFIAVMVHDFLIRWCACITGCVANPVPDPDLQLLKLKYFYHLFYEYLKKKKCLIPFVS
jgi:hypothetical protein